jgi:hypothetical protein
MKEQEKRGMVFMKEEDIFDQKRPTLSVLGCNICDIALCKILDCWVRWHSQA